MTFIAEVIISHVRSMADMWRKQECDALLTADVSELLKDLTPVETRRVTRAVAILSENIKAHQAAICFDMLANDLEDLKEKLSEDVTPLPNVSSDVRWHS